MSSWPTLWSRLEGAFSLGSDVADPPHLRRLKVIFVAAMAGAFLYSLIFFFLPSRSDFEHIIDLFGMASCLLGLLVLWRSRDLQLAFALLTMAVLPVLAAYYLVHGNRDGDLLFAILLPVAAVTFLGPRRSRLYLILCLGTVVGVWLLDQTLPRVSHEWAITPLNPEGWVFHAPDKYRFRAVEIVTFASVTVLIYILCHGGAGALRDANRRIESLLLNILPRSIADRLSANPVDAQAGTIVDRYDNVSILFADIVGFTELSQKMEPGALVALLNTLFTEFDRITAQHKVEKIKTIGDAYMAVCGLPEPDVQHAARIANVALDMVSAVNRLNETSSHALDIRIGIHSGPVVAGVIGLHKFAYDLWGETVNTASRMESHGQPGVIQCSESTRKLLASTFDFEPRGQLKIKGYDTLATYKLIGRKNH